MKKLILVLFLLGCVSGESLQINAKLEKTYSMCRGAVVAEDAVITVGHCIERSRKIWADYTPVVAAVKIPGLPESLILLKFEEEIFNKIYPIAKEDFTPKWIDGPHGRVLYKRGVVQPGWSGSPVLNNNGKLVGLISGYDNHGDPVMTRLPRNFEERWLN